MIGGNITFDICKYVAGSVRNEIGERAGDGWSTEGSITGWLDLQNGDSNYTEALKKVPDATHVFIADYVELPTNLTSNKYQYALRVKNSLTYYDIMYVDNPMGMNRQLEFYLKLRRN